MTGSDDGDDVLITEARWCLDVDKRLYEYGAHSSVQLNCLEMRIGIKGSGHQRS